MLFLLHDVVYFFVEQRTTFGFQLESSRHLLIPRLNVRVSELEHELKFIKAMEMEKKRVEKSKYLVSTFVILAFRLSKERV